MQGQVSRGELTSETLQQFRPAAPESLQMMQDSQDNTKKHLCHCATQRAGVALRLHWAPQLQGIWFQRKYLQLTNCFNMNHQGQEVSRDSVTEDGSAVCCEPAGQRQTIRQNPGVPALLEGLNNT